jgi:4-aminobutyrate--pyruvate transaminase
MTKVLTSWNGVRVSMSGTPKEGVTSRDFQVFGAPPWGSARRPWWRPQQSSSKNCPTTTYSAARARVRPLNWGNALRPWRPSRFPRSSSSTRVRRPRKKKIISRNKAYHGVTVAAGSLTGLPSVHQDFNLPIPGILHTDCPHHYRFAGPGETEEAFATRLAENLENLILEQDPDTVAAFIAEPVMGAGGVIVPPKTYFQKIQAVLKKYDIVFIDDEVICGFGRTGNMFGCETLGFTPDTISVAKSLSSAYLPIGAVLIPDDIYQSMLNESRKLGTFGHGFTYSGHPVCAAVALRNLDLFEERGILNHVRDIVPQFQRRLKALGDHRLVGEARGMGLMGGCELVADKSEKRSFIPKQGVGLYFAARAEDNGLIVRSLGDVIALCPPLIITKEEVDELFDRFHQALEDTDVWVEKEGLRSL